MIESIEGNIRDGNLPNPYRIREADIGYRLYANNELAVTPADVNRFMAVSPKHTQLSKVVPPTQFVCPLSLAEQVDRGAVIARLQRNYLEQLYAVQELAVWGAMLNLGITSEAVHSFSFDAQLLPPGRLRRHYFWSPLVVQRQMAEQWYNVVTLKDGSRVELPVAIPNPTRPEHRDVGSKLEA